MKRAGLESVPLTLVRRWLPDVRPRILLSPPCWPSHGHDRECLCVYGALEANGSLAPALLRRDRRRLQARRLGMMILEVGTERECGHLQNTKTLIISDISGPTLLDSSNVEQSCAGRYAQQGTMRVSRAQPKHFEFGALAVASAGGRDGRSWEVRPRLGVPRRQRSCSSACMLGLVARSGAIFGGLRRQSLGFAGSHLECVKRYESSFAEGSRIRNKHVLRL